MADELRERARARFEIRQQDPCSWLIYFGDEQVEELSELDGAEGWVTDWVTRIASVAAAERALAIEECAKIAHSCNRGHHGHDCGHAVEILQKIRSLTPLPTDGEDFGDVSEDQK